MNRKESYSVIPVIKRISCGFLPAKVAPIHACSLGKLGTGEDGTTSDGEIPTTNYLM